MIDLYYWPMIPGRGEYVRLVLEATAVPYRDVARLPESEGGGITAMMRFMEERSDAHSPFAPPFIVEGDTLIAQTAVIVAHLGETHGLAPGGQADRLFARSVAATTADLVAEAHDTHHPVGVSLYYEDQRAEAARRAAEFRRERIPKFLGWYERLLASNPAGVLAGDRLSYADLGLFHTMEGLRYALPKRMAALAEGYPRIEVLCRAVRAHPRIADYLASSRRLPFNEEGIFRAYPELDGE